MTVARSNNAWRGGRRFAGAAAGTTIAARSTFRSTQHDCGSPRTWLSPYHPACSHACARQQSSA